MGINLQKSKGRVEKVRHHGIRARECPPKLSPEELKKEKEGPHGIEEFPAQNIYVKGNLNYLLVKIILCMENRLSKEENGILMVKTIFMFIHLRPQMNGEKEERFFIKGSLDTN